MRLFLDTEFVEDGKTIDLISIGIVAEDGRELYLQNASAGFEKANDWVWENVFHSLSHFNLRQQQRACKAIGGGFVCGEAGCSWDWLPGIRGSIISFCDPDQYGKPEFWGYYADYDWVVLCQLFGTMMDLPKGWPMLCYDLRQWLDFRGLHSVSQPDDMPHHALGDARWVAETWRKHGGPLP